MLKRLLVVCICFCIIACDLKKDEGETVTVADGAKFPIKGCIEANSRIFGASIDHKIFCKCLISRLYQDMKSDPEILALLKENNWSTLSKEKMTVVYTYYETCLKESATTDSTTKVTLTPRMRETIKKNMKAQLTGTAIDQTNDLDDYCECIIYSIENDFTAKEFMQSDYSESEKYQKVMEKCLKLTKKR